MLQQLKQFSIYSTFGALSSLVGLLTVPYLTRVLSPEDYGVVGIFMSVLFFLIPMLSISSEGLVGINKVNYSADRYQSFANQYLSLLLISLLISLGICSLLASFIDEYLIFLFGLPIIAFMQATYRMHSSELIQDKKSVPFGAYNLALSLTLFTVTYICISILGLDWQGRILALIVAEVVFFGLRGFLTFNSLRRFRFKISYQFFVEVLKYGGPLIILLLAAWVFNEADRFIVLGFLDLADVGIYVAAYSLGMAINVLNNAMTNTVAPIIYRLVKEGKHRKKLQKISILYSIFILLISMFVAVIFYFWGDLILGEGYEKGVSVTCIVLIAFGFNGMYRTVGLPLDYLKLNVLKTWNFSIAAVFNLVASIVLFDAIGLLAPALGTLISFIFLYMLTFYFSIKHTRFLSD